MHTLVLLLNRSFKSLEYIIGLSSCIPALKLARNNCAHHVKTLFSLPNELIYNDAIVNTYHLTCEMMHIHKNDFSSKQILHLIYNGSKSFFNFIQKNTQKIKLVRKYNISEKLLWQEQYLLSSNHTKRTFLCASYGKSL